MGAGGGGGIKPCRAKISHDNKIALIKLAALVKFKLKKKIWSMGRVKL